MKKIIGITAMALMTLAACDVTHPVAVVGPSDTVFHGTATATFLVGGWFQASNGKTSCSGRYAPSPDAVIVMRDGTKWRFIFGQNALLV